ncbi:MAG: T9SS type A sorting domain-containing protein [Ignavibacteria bacterium]|nr:T9SS type A sorting domain-containing protein [Ignavibacteria bacterium]
MKILKLTMFLLLMVLFSKNVFGHKEWVHQHIAREAYYFLENQLGFELTEFKSHIGLSYYGYGVPDYDPWNTGLVVVGAWAEDENDIIWNYGGWFDGWTPSSTHFWHGDLGDDTKTPIPASPDAYNAYYKAKIYLFGGHSIFFAKKAFDPFLGGDILGRFISYNSLIEFFNTGHCYLEGYMDISGTTHFFPPEEYYIDLDAAQRRAYQILGHVVHLLTDLGVPAHAHADLHPCPLNDEDAYEMYMGNPDGCDGEPNGYYPAQDWTATTAATQGGFLDIDGMNDFETIRYLFYTQQQIADHFPSGRSGSGYHPGNNYLVNGTNDYLISRYAVLGPSPFYSFDTNEMHLIADESFNLSIRTTATLYKWFASKTNLIPNTYYVNFQNNFIGVGNIGNINVSGTVYTSPTNNFSVTQGNTITATAINQTLNNIDYTFSNWSNGSTDVTTTFTVTANATYTANFIGKPNNVSGVHFINQNMQPITILWNEHPNVNVTQYQIWRKVKYKKGTTGPPVLIGTVNRGTNSFVDNDYMGTNLGFTDWLLFYDVKAYYSIEQTYSDDTYVSIFANGSLIMEIKKNNEEILSVVKENSLENYPNPFNPSTMIQYQIIEGGFVSVKVYDNLGREVAVLVNKEQPSGRYSVTFDASKLSSGVYFYTINAKDFNKVKKMILLR